jgi:hypothetical protein
MTAIAAVIALYSTPLLAQAADGTATQAAPIVIAPPAPDISSVSVPDAASAPVDAAPVMRTMSTPVEHTEATPSDRQPEPVHATSRISSNHAAARAPAKQAAGDVVPADAQRAGTQVPATPAPASAVAAPIAALPPVATVNRASHLQSVDDEALPIAGAIGLGLIAVGGAAFALRRRRREDRNDEFLVEQESMPAPVFAAAPVAVAAPAVRKAKALPGGFDASRFGRHTQAAYAGPTADNPFLSLRRRLSRASFLDQREREASAAGTSVKRTLVEPVYPATAANSAKDDGQVTIRMTPQRKAGRRNAVLQK